MGLVLRFDPPSRYGEDAGSRLPRGEQERERASAADELPVDHPDKAIVEALYSGDEAGFESVYTRYAATVYEFAQRYVDPDIAKDVVQDVFLALWRRRTTVVIAGCTGISVWCRAASGAASPAESGCQGWLERACDG